MENEQSKHLNTELPPPSNPEQKENSPNLEFFASEIETIKASIQKRKSEITTLKILFYTGLAVLLFGFIYTSQTLQRAQYRTIELNIDNLQNQVSHTLLLLEKKLQKEIHDLDAKSNEQSGSGFYNAIQNMNQMLDKIEPQTTSMGILIEKVQRNANELSQMVRALQNQDERPPIP
jgi:hypothetical protein